jgi:hypothetical protein
MQGVRGSDLTLRGSAIDGPTNRAGGWPGITAQALPHRANRDSGIGKKWQRYSALLEQRDLNRSGTLLVNLRIIAERLRR